MFGKTGLSVQVSSSREVVLSEDVRRATKFQLVGCRARDAVPDAVLPRCFSLMDASCTGWYVRHGSFFLRVDPESDSDNLPLFDLDSSFILHSDTFYPDHFALESVNFRNWYIKSHADGRLGIVQRTNTTDYYDTASFGVYIYNVSSEYLLPPLSLRYCAYC